MRKPATPPGCFSRLTSINPNANYTNPFKLLAALCICALLGLNAFGQTTNFIADGGFEIPAANSCLAANWTGSANDTFDSVYATNSWGGGAVLPHSGSFLMYIEATTAASDPAAPDANLQSDLFPITGGTNCVVSFYAAIPVHVGGGNPQVQIAYYTSGGAFISNSGFQSFASVGAGWTLFSFTNAVPANATQANLLFIEAVGAGASWDWVTLLDDVSVTGPLGVSSPPPTASSVTVDPSQNWLGFMNWSPTAYTSANFPSDGGNDGNGQAWGTTALPAVFNSSLLTISPNVNVYDSTSDPYWVNPDGTGANNMDASFYVESTTLAGQTVTFSGYVWNNSLAGASNNVAGPYTSVAFINDFGPGFVLNASVTTNLLGALPPNGFFSINLATTAGDTIQYGFETVGPDANPATVASLGTVVVASNAPPAGPIVTGILPASPVYVNVTSNTSLVASISGGTAPLTYQWQQNGVNLTNGASVSGAQTTTLNLINVAPTAEGNYSLVAKDSLNRAATNSDYVVVFNPGSLTMDPNAAYNAFINVYTDNAGSVGPYEFGFGYSIPLLRAGIIGNEAVVQPNTAIYADDLGNPIYINADGTPNAYLEQDYYIQNAALAGNTLTFTGYCPTNTIDPSYVVSAWLTDFAPGFSASTTTNTVLSAGQNFSLTLPTTAGDTIQYGLRVLGLDNSPTSPLTLGSAYVTIVRPALQAARASGVNRLSFSSTAGHNYTLQYKINLTDSTWTSLASMGGTGSTITITDSTAVAHRFYRLSIQ
jgi:hypothetical protein